MADPESRSVFDAAQDAVLLRGLTLLTGVAAGAWGTEPAPVSHGAWGFAGQRGWSLRPSSCRPQRRSSVPSTA